MAGDSLESRLASTNSLVELLHAATRGGDACPGFEHREIVEDKQVCVVHLQTGEARLNLWGHRLVQTIDLDDHEHAIAIPFERLPYDLLAVPSLIAGSGVNEVETSIEGPPYGGHELLQRQL